MCWTRSRTFGCKWKVPPTKKEKKLRFAVCRAALEIRDGMWNMCDICRGNHFTRDCPKNKLQFFKRRKAKHPTLIRKHKKKKQIRVNITEPRKLKPASTNTEQNPVNIKPKKPVTTSTITPSVESSILLPDTNEDIIGISTTKKSPTSPPISINISKQEGNDSWDSSLDTSDRVSDNEMAITTKSGLIYTCGSTSSRMSSSHAARRSRPKIYYNKPNSARYRKREPTTPIMRSTLSAVDVKRVADFPFIPQNARQLRMESHSASRKLGYGITSSLPFRRSRRRRYITPEKFTAVTKSNIPNFTFTHKFRKKMAFSRRQTSTTKGHDEDTKSKTNGLNFGTNFEIDPLQDSTFNIRGRQSARHRHKPVQASKAIMKYRPVTRR